MIRKYSMNINNSYDTLSISSRSGCSWTNYNTTNNQGGWPGGGMQDGNSDKGDHSTKGIKAENQIDFLNCAVMCGLGERSMINSLLTPEYGPFIRYCFILTDAEIEESKLCEANLCDKCGECIKACPGKAIKDDGKLDSWRCAVYYNGANGTKNPFMNPDAFPTLENRLEIIAGEAKVTPETAKKDT